MGLFEKSSTITEADLQALVADRETEGKTLDYKRDLVGQSDPERKEFLYDASSFANTLGGDLVFWHGGEERPANPAHRAFWH